MSARGEVRDDLLDYCKAEGIRLYGAEATYLAAFIEERCADYFAEGQARVAELEAAARLVVKSFREVEHNRQLYDVATHRCVDNLRALVANEETR